MTGACRHWPPWTLGPELVGSFVDLTEKRDQEREHGGSCLWCEVSAVLATVPMGRNRPGGRDREVPREEIVFDAGRFQGLKQNFVIPYEALAKRLHGKDYFVDFSNTLCDRADPANQAERGPPQRPGQREGRQEYGPSPARKNGTRVATKITD